MSEIVSIDPATLQENGRVKAASPDDVHAAVAAARIAQATWGARTLADRTAVLQEFARLLLAEKRAVAEIVTREAGKPFPESLAAEVLPPLESVKWLASEGRKALADEVIRNKILVAKNRHSRIRWTPRGVVGIIGAWNYPFGLPASTSLFALFAGNAVVLKPSEETPLVAEKLKDLLHRAGVPKDAFQVVQGEGRVTGDALARSRIDFMHFTGSVATGDKVNAACRANGVETCLELGGSDPAIVLEDADLDVAANGILWGRFAAAGQTCAAVKRVFVVEEVAEAFERKLVEKAAKIRVGSGLDKGVDMGPLITAHAAHKMEEFVADAVKRGARVALGGKKPPRAGHFFEPTILLDVPRDARVLHEEVFGPVLPVVRVPDAEEAIRRANETEFGLSASVWTKDVRRGELVAERIHAGSVTVNDAVYHYALVEAPWMGWKKSGHGATHHVMGLREFAKPQHVNVTPAMRPIDQLWWFPYSDDDVDTWSRALDFLYGSPGDKVAQALPVAGRMARKKNL